MNSERESQLREATRKSLESALRDNDSYVQAAESGAVSLDDLYFIYMIGNAHIIESSRLEDNEELLNPIIKATEAIIEIDLEQSFRNTDKIRGERYKIVGDLYHISPEEAQRRYESIQDKVTSWISKRGNDPSQN